MYTCDPYKGMEISINVGDAKRLFAVVTGSRTVRGKVVVDVITTTRTINTAMTLNIESVRERK
jgi:hypothetical protein